MKWFVTFATYHPLADNWIEVEADDYSEARHVAFTLFGRRYGSVYDTDSFRSEFFEGGKVGKTVHLTDISGGL